MSAIDQAHANHGANLRAIVLALVALMPAAVCATAPPEPQPEPAPEPAPAPPAAATQTSSFTFQDLGLLSPASLQGVDGGVFLPFGTRRDQTVVSARLILNYSYSPALLPEISHLKVLLNGEPMATLPVPQEGAGREQSAEIALDPRYFTDYNRIGVQLIGHYTRECEDAQHSSLWATVSNQSRIELSLRPLQLMDDLALLPAPFFDERDGKRLDLPFVFAAKPSLDVLRQAGVVASWFGAMASYRSARFPVLLGELPARHAVVFATDTEKPAGLELPAAPAPLIALVPHPADPAVKLLLIRARDAAGLKTAVDALTLGHAAFSGAVVSVKTPVEMTPREAYDAPNWLRMDGPVKLGDLVRLPADLEISGANPQPIVINARLPPDLLTWNQGGVPVDLKYRYTPPPEQDNSLLTVQINDQFVQSFRLRPEGGGSPVSKLSLPILGGDLFQAQDAFLIPAFRVGSDNQLQFHFNLDPHRTGLCRNVPGSALRAAIDPDSSIDLSAFPHYAAMPNLALFVNGGFPFSTYADLSGTAVVLPDVPAVPQIEAMLFTLGRMGRITGAPASALRLIGSSQVEAADDFDLLLIDTATLLAKWKQGLPTLIERGRREFSLGSLVRWMPLGTDPAAPASTGSRPRVSLETEGALAALAGFRSPLDSGRSVVALTANAPEALSLALDALEQSDLVSRIRGDLVLIRGGEVESLQTGTGTYFTGRLPPHTWLWFHISRYPLLMALLGLIAALLVGLGIYGYLGKVAARRLAQ